MQDAHKDKSIMAQGQFQGLTLREYIFTATLQGILAGNFVKRKSGQDYQDYHDIIVLAAKDITERALKALPDGPIQSQSVD